jgi:hypothetical protein
MRTFFGEPGKLELQKSFTAAELAKSDNSADQTITLAISGNRLVSILNALDASLYATGKYELVGDDIVAASSWYAELRAVSEAVRDELSRQRCAPKDPQACPTCQGKSYIVCERSDGKRAIERCDACSANCLSDQQAATLARHDGIKCAESYPCFILE